METRTDLTEFTHKMDEIRQHISDIIVGQTKAVDMVLTSIIADGHVLLEGVPGVAKTLLARLVSRLIDARFSRIQFTPRPHAKRCSWHIRFQHENPRV